MGKEFETWNYQVFTGRRSVFCLYEISHHSNILDLVSAVHLLHYLDFVRISVISNGYIYISHGIPLFISYIWTRDLKICEFRDNVALELLEQKQAMREGWKWREACIQICAYSLHILYTVLYIVYSTS